MTVPTEARVRENVREEIAVGPAWDIKSVRDNVSVAHHERQWLASPATESQIQTWRGQVRGALGLPVDAEHPSAETPDVESPQGGAR
ncbi:hypothetical protein [Mycobacterium sp. IS-1556]|uniref:hypothetical protein n=1 Tax=Mycobacterium sp. IS-1556 TaxID=1772276 RepID=UPI000741505D|nr:hypothetical protein [Mycobacterium sp. IS-1556]KUH84783.1 hypothetical protein AU187_19910 [Mycobacterium sp. IS-1556]